MGTTATAPLQHTKPKSGGQILAAALKAHGVERLSCVAGESYLPVLDALLDHPSIQTITCRHEGEAAFMAESWGKLSSKAGVCFVTRGPGATNASIGVHTAMQDSSPMILFVGQVARADKGREAFQEFDTKQAFTPWAKEAFDIPNAAQIPEAVNRAFRLAQSGRMGPVVVGLPEDILIETADVSIAEPETPSRHGLNKTDLSAIRDALQKSSKPLIIAGGNGWSDAACADLDRFAKSAHISVVAAWRCHDVIDSRSSCFAGELGMGANPKLIEKIKTECDLILALGTRLDEITVQGYTLFDLPTPRQTLIHIHPSETDIGKVYAPTLGIVSDVNDAAAALAGAGFGIDGRGWDSWRGELRGLYDAFTTLDLSALPRWNGADMNAIFAHLREALPEDSIVTSDAGNFSIWVRRYLRHGRPARMLAPISGAMGYGAPAAVGAALAHPDRKIVGFAGDGGFMMTGAHALATAIQSGAKPVFIVCNNGIYGTIRMHQERDFPNRPSGTSLTNPDFVKLAESFGTFGVKVDHTDMFPSALDAALNANRPALIEIKMDARQLTPTSAP